MLNKIVAVFIAILFSSIAFGEIDVEVSKTQALSGMTNPRIFKEFVFYEKPSEPKFISAAILKIKTEAKFVKVKARKTLFENGDVFKISNDEFLLVGSGKYAVEIATFDPEKGIDEKTVSVELGEEPQPVPGPDIPTPNPTPTPDVPDDKFGNIGKKVATWSAGLPKRLELANVYKEASKRLDEDPAATITQVGEDLLRKRIEVLGSDIEKYSSFTEKLSNDLKTIWPLGRKDYSEYLLAISKGLGGK